MFMVSQGGHHLSLSLFGCCPLASRVGWDGLTDSKGFTSLSLVLGNTECATSYRPLLLLFPLLGRIAP